MRFPDAVGQVPVPWLASGQGLWAARGRSPGLATRPSPKQFTTWLSCSSRPAGTFLFLPLQRAQLFRNLTWLDQTHTTRISLLIHSKSTNLRPCLQLQNLPTFLISYTWPLTLRTEKGVNTSAYHTCGTMTGSEIRGSAVREHVKPLRNAGERHRDITGRGDLEWDREGRNYAWLPKEPLMYFQRFLTGRERSCRKSWIFSFQTKVVLYIRPFTLRRGIVSLAQLRPERVGQFHLASHLWSTGRVCTWCWAEKDSETVSWFSRKEFCA